LASALHNGQAMHAQLAVVPRLEEPAPRPSGVQAFALEDVSRRFGPRWALCRLTHQLPAGTSLLLTGHNGSGKTTLLRLLATALRPTAGRLRVLGLDTATQTEQVRRKVALLSHANFLYEDLTAQQNLALLGRLLGLREVEAEAARVLEKLGLTQRAHHPVRQFSAGMRKRMAIGRLLLKEPELALLDEPFGELDPQGIEQMEQIIAELKAKGTTLVLATHLIDQGERLCDARLHLENGWKVSA
jgi:heme exporter protein A